MRNVLIIESNGIDVSYAYIEDTSLIDDSNMRKSLEYSVEEKKSNKYIGYKEFDNGVKVRGSEISSKQYGYYFSDNFGVKQGESIEVDHVIRHLI